MGKNRKIAALPPFPHDAYEKLLKEEIRLAKGEEEKIDGMKGKVLFYPLSPTPVRSDTKASLFIVRTYKPIEWGIFRLLVLKALAEVL